MSYKFIKRCLLFAALGSSSIILAGCYGMPTKYMNEPPLNRAPAYIPGEPTQNLETEPVPWDDYIGSENL
jgi:hypothetical protein